ncbi:MAG TPA: hypothetical protein VHZ95_17535, partial [Polyangiales bacterium]|nr:hypothetical protein [Polyangiales bacterium]
QLAAEDASAVAVSFEALAHESPDVLGGFDRDVRRARVRFHHCLAAAELFDRQRQLMAAQEQLSACARDFPGLDPELGAGTDARMQAFLSRAGASFDASDATRLTIATEPTAAVRCTARVNGIDRGHTPVTIDKLHTPRVRVEVDCGQQPGRVYDIALASSERTLTIHPALDRALDDGGRLALAYDNVAKAEADRVRHGLVLANAVGADHVIEVERDLLRRIDVATGREVASAAIGGEASIDRALDALISERSVPPPSAAKEPARPSAVAASRPFRTLGYVASGLAAAGVATAIVAWRVRASHVDRFNHSPDCTQADSGTLPAGCRRELDDASSARALLGTGAIVGSAGLLIAGTLFVLDANRDRADRRDRIACGPGASDVAIACGLRF